MNLETLIKNKYYIFAKYLTGALLVFAGILSLVASWFAGKETTAAVIVHTSSLADSLRIALMVLGFVALVVAVVLLSTKNKAILSVSVISIALAMIVVLIILSGVAIDQTNWIKVTTTP